MFNEAEGSSSDPKVANRARFEVELEFVQSLANPFYLHSLAQQNILEQPAFINFLEYLQYFRDKDYARFIHYPHALHHLELLQHAQEYLHQKQFDHWRTWRDPTHTNKTNDTSPAVDGGEGPSTMSST
ncbi:SOH1 family protein [Armillaria luteobubalina]|uniref:Mediator of RNA polymerase II transcription subunit 31 n=1 Tax=Armillaria luteobubalina TaxID=153913 RepID=A0AA39PHM1_9AGAR|nr:SOH1 family protein [Armillaria luteobubalina]